MPLYCYSDLNGGNVFEKRFSIGKAPKSITIAGVVLKRDYAAEHSGQRSGDAWTNHRSMSLGCHPSQAKEFEKAFAEAGCPTKFCEKTGDAIFESRSHRFNHLKARSRMFGGHWVNFDENRG